MSFKTQCSDPHEWAHKPRSVIAFDHVKDVALRDTAFQEIVKGLVNQGICTAEGKLLKRWKDGQWEDVYDE